LYSRHYELHSFPTRRSSDLRKNGLTMSEGVRILLELDLRGETLSLHRPARARTPRTVPMTPSGKRWSIVPYLNPDGNSFDCPIRSEEHTSELQSRENLVCRL